MAINCATAIIDENTEFTYLSPNIEYNGEILHLNDADFYKYDMYENETMTYIIRVFPQDLNPINMTLTLYKMDGEVAIEVGTAYLNQFYNTFEYDGNPGEYRFCLKSQYHVEYILEVEFTDYPYIIFPSFDFYHGSYTHPFEFAKPVSLCDSQVYYELVDGELPPGLVFHSSGYIDGIPEELDCSTPAGTAPSFMFYEEYTEGDEYARISITFDFPITIRAALVEDPSTYEDRDFKVCVRNNWDYDRDAYLAALPNLQRQRFTDIRLVEDIQAVAAPVAEEQQCPECPEEEKQYPQLTELQIQELCDICQINPEYVGLIEINNRHCVPCEQPEELQPPELVEIEDEGFCVPCPEPEIVVGLQPIEKTLCACSVDTEEEPEIVLYELAPDFCLDEFLYRMKNEKVCSGPITCPIRSPIYDLHPDDGKIVFENICQQECSI